MKERETSIDSKQKLHDKKAFWNYVRIANFENFDESGNFVILRSELARSLAPNRRIDRGLNETFS